MKKLLLVIDAQKSFINEITEPYVKKYKNLLIQINMKKLLLQSL